MSSMFPTSGPVIFTLNEINLSLLGLISTKRKAFQHLQPPQGLLYLNFLVPGSQRERCLPS